MATTAQDMTDKPKHPGGRPTDYSPDLPEKVKSLCLLGMTDKELAKSLDISERTLNVWKQTYPEFMQSIREGKEIADANVAKSLYKRACGTDEIPADTRAAQFWLMNRRRQDWTQDQDKQGLSVNVTINRGTTEVEVKGQTLEIDHD